MNPRSHSNIRVAAITLTLAGAAATAPASAYCRTTSCPKCDFDDKGCPTGTPLVWRTSCVTFSMQYGASTQVDLATATGVMEKAFATWSGASCPVQGVAPSIHIDHRFGDVACTLHEYNRTDANANVILFYDDEWPYKEAPETLGLTTVTYKAGVIVDVDMEINATLPLSVSDPVPLTSYDLQSIVTHETGHFLGLAHSLDRTATMWREYTTGAETFRRLAPDDVEGICAVYPPARVAACDPNPDRGFSPLCGIFPSGNAGQCSVRALGSARTTEARETWLGLAVGMAMIALVGRRATRRGRPREDEDVS